MTPEKINAKIHEKLGLSGKPLNYYGSLDAMQTVWEWLLQNDTLLSGLRDKYSDEIYEKSWTEALKVGGAITGFQCHLTAPQKAECFCRAAGIWEEE